MILNQQGLNEVIRSPSVVTTAQIPKPGELSKPAQERRGDCREPSSGNSDLFFCLSPSTLTHTGSAPHPSPCQLLSELRSLRTPVSIRNESADGCHWSRPWPPAPCLSLSLPRTHSLWIGPRCAVQHPFYWSGGAGGAFDSVASILAFLTGETRTSGGSCIAGSEPRCYVRR